MRKAINYIILMLCMSLVACSDDSKTELTTVDAQKAYNDAKGTYKGYVLDENVPTPIYLTLGQEMTVKDLPVTSLLNKFFSGSELDEAVASVKERQFNIPTASMAIAGDLVFIIMEPTDWLFSATVGGKTHNISALISATVRYTHTYEKLSASIVVNELYCDSQKADLSSNSVSWLIDEAKKQ